MSTRDRSDARIAWKEQKEDLRSRSCRSGFVAIAALYLVAVLVGPAGAAPATPTPVSSCQTLDSPGAYQLSADLTAVDETCIEITASDVKLDLAGHTMTCTGSGFEGSCQRPAFRPHGVFVGPGLSGVVLKGPGTITGFRNGVMIEGSDVHAKGLTVTGPPCSDPNACARPNGSAIFVVGRIAEETPAGAFPDFGEAAVNISGNQVSNYHRGIGIWFVNCPAGGGCVVNNNEAHDIYGGNPQGCFGVDVVFSTGYTFSRNVAHDNGNDVCSAFGQFFPDAAIGGGLGIFEGSGLVFTNNDFSNNRGHGIHTAGSDSHFVNNTARGNTETDLWALEGTSNEWNANNRCNTSSGEVPPSVCNPGE